MLGTVVARAGAAPDARRPCSAAPGASGLGVDMGINEAGYAVWSAGGDVRAARLDEGTAWTPLAAPLDVDPARLGRRGRSRPRVAVSAEGNAVVVWGEATPTGATTSCRAASPGSTSPSPRRT